MSIIDCGPGILAIWKCLKGEIIMKGEIIKILFERGPVDEILMDSGTVFRSRDFETLCIMWHIRKILGPQTDLAQMG